jgi:hypothetical protein
MRLMFVCVPVTDLDHVQESPYIVGVLVFLAPYDVYVQAMVAIFVVQLASGLHIAARPYESTMLHKYDWWWLFRVE